MTVIIPAILEDFITNEAFNDVPPEEHDAYITYCESVMQGEAVFYGPDEQIPFEVTP